MSNQIRAINTCVVAVKNEAGKTEIKNFAPGQEFETDEKTAKFLTESGSARFVDDAKQKAVAPAEDRSVPGAGNKETKTLTTSKGKTEDKA